MWFCLGTRTLGLKAIIHAQALQLQVESEAKEDAKKKKINEQNNQISKTESALALFRLNSNDMRKEHWKTLLKFCLPAADKTTVPSKFNRIKAIKAKIGEFPQFCGKIGMFCVMNYLILLKLICLRWSRKILLIVIWIYLH